MIVHVTYTTAECDHLKFKYKMPVEKFTQL